MASGVMINIEAGSPERRDCLVRPANRKFRHGSDAEGQGFPVLLAGDVE